MSKICRGEYSMGASPSCVTFKTKGLTGDSLHPTHILRKEHDDESDSDE